MANMKIGTRLRCSVEEAAKLLQVVSVFHLQQGPAHSLSRRSAPAVPRLLA